MCKSFKDPIINISKKNGQLSFCFDEPEISSKSLCFGKFQKDDTSLYFKQFKSELFSRIGKLSSFASETIKIFVESENESQILIETSSQLGTIKVYIPCVDE
jgi:hypothetical protein